MKNPELTLSREKILQSAAWAFARKGFDAASMQEIADRAKVNKALLFYYFKSKEKLYSYLIKSSIEDFITRLEKAAASSNELVERLKQIMLTILEQMEKKRDLARILIKEMGIMGEQLKKNIDLLNRIIGVVEELIKEGIKAGKFRAVDPTLTAVSILSLMRSFAMRRIFLGEPSKEAILQHTWDLILNGILAKHPEKRGAR